MSDKRNPHDQGPLISVARQKASKHQREQAERRLQERSESGRYLAVLTEEQWDEVLERIAAGDIDSRIMADHGLTRAAIVAKRRRDPDFERRYFEAVSEAYLNIAQDIRHVTRGVPGYSTGDVRRDELVAKYDLELAKRFAARILGDKVQVDQRQIVIKIDPDEGSW